MLPEEYMALQRWPSAAIRQILARSLGLPVGPEPADWERVDADPANLTRLLAALEENEELDDDERFNLMEMTLEALERLPSAALEKTDEWRRVRNLLRASSSLHATTIWSWACLEDEADGDVEEFRLSPAMAEVWHEVEPVIAERLDSEEDES